MRKRRQDAADRGAQAVEFALLVPVVLLLIGALVQFAFVFNAQVTSTQAARDGARFAAVCGDPATSACQYYKTAGNTVQSFTQDHAPGVTLSSVSVQFCTNATPAVCTGSTSTPAYCPPSGTQADGNAVVITSYTYNIGAPLLPFTVTVTGKSSTPCGG